MIFKYKIFSYSVFFMALLVMSSWTKEESSGLEKESLSGQELFKEIVFAEGTEFRNDLPEYANYLVGVKKQGLEKGFHFSEFKEFTINFIEQQDPYFFKNFKQVILGKNPYKIKELFSRSLSLVSIAEVVNSTNEKSKDKYTGLLSEIDISDTGALNKVAKEIFTNFQSDRKAAISEEVCIILPPIFMYVIPPPCMVGPVMVCNIVMVASLSAEDMQKATLLNEKLVNAILKNY